ncbi:MAG: tetratricopeptide repeat protein [Alphaproteobacteria bacterium]
MRRAPAICIAALLLAGAASAKDYPLDEQPMYGGVDLKSGQVEPDKEILTACMKLTGGKMFSATVSDACMSLGFKAFFKGDYRRAMLFFNNGWALRQDNGSAYHGFALVLIERDKNDAEAEKMFQKAIASPIVTPDANMDYGRFLILRERYADAIPVLEAGMAKAEYGKEDFQFALFAVYEQLLQYPKACALAREAIGQLKDDRRQTVQEFIGGEHCRAS